MRTVWKIGSRWGNCGESVLEKFLDYGCVFFGSALSGGKRGDWGAVGKGDLIIISDGATPIAIAESLGTFTNYEESGIPFRKGDADRFVDDEVRICHARILLLTDAARSEDWGIDPRKTFCRANRAAEKANRYWEKCGTKPMGEFEIKAKTATLFSAADKTGKESLFRENIRYRIPIFQRPYSWGESELRRLMEEIKQAVELQEPVFLGTIQLDQPAILSKDGTELSYAVIDGQQRLTTLMLLLALLEKAAASPVAGGMVKYLQKNFRTSVNKRAAQDDLDAAVKFLADSGNCQFKVSESERNPYIRNIGILNGLLRELAASEDETTPDASEEDIKSYATKLIPFLSDKIRMVVIETHAGLSKTLKIFNTINTAGLDLGMADLFKVRFYEYRKRKGDGDDVFDRISDVYEKIEKYNRSPHDGAYLNMENVLSVYQRLLIGKGELNASTFTMSQERFFEQLFDSELKIHAWPDFSDLKVELTVEELDRIVDCYIQYFKTSADDPDLKIFRQLLWDTRYGYAYNYPVIALSCGAVTPETVKSFTKGLVKSLVPASLYFGKTVSHGRSLLIDLLRAICKGDFKAGDSIVSWCHSRWSFNGLQLTEMTRRAMDYQIAWYPKWKNLLCRLVEYCKTPEESRDGKLFNRLFNLWFDIEHVQSCTPESEADKRRLEEWGDELNKIGNLVLFEGSSNRSVHNHRELKRDAYANSAYVSLRELSSRVQEWTKDDAIKRRETLTDLIVGFLQEEK